MENIVLEDTDSCAKPKNHFTLGKSRIKIGRQKKSIPPTSATNVSFAVQMMVSVGNSN